MIGRPMVWDFTARNRLRALMSGGATYKEAAEELGTTRGAIAGACDRYQIESKHPPGRNAKVIFMRLPPKPPRAPPSKQTRQAATAVATGIVQRARISPLGIPTHTVVKDAPAIVKREGAFLPLPGTTPRPMRARSRFECSWPVGGEGSDLMACCAPVEDTADGQWQSSWCSAHNAVGRVKPPRMNMRNPDLRRKSA